MAPLSDPLSAARSDDASPGGRGGADYDPLSVAAAFAEGLCRTGIWYWQLPGRRVDCGNDTEPADLAGHVGRTGAVRWRLRPCCSRTADRKSTRLNSSH